MRRALAGRRVRRSGGALLESPDVHESVFDLVVHPVAGGKRLGPEDRQVFRLLR